MFQHTAARRRLQTATLPPFCIPPFQHTAARRRLLYVGLFLQNKNRVSTHSRPRRTIRMDKRGFNTQPPEGGCARTEKRGVMDWRFNTQPPEGGCAKS